MSRIFFAELRRLVHYRLYHAACAAVVLFSLFYAEPPVVDRFLFYIMIVIGAFSAVCVSQFIGVEYSCGTIRNKLVTGHTRTEIYLAQLVLHILAAVILFHISILTIVIAGALFNWTYDSSVQILIVYYIACMCTIVLITAVSVFVSMQSSSTMASFVILLLLYAGLSMLGTNCHGALLEQEIQMTDTSQAGNPPEEMDAGIRMCFEYLLLINPYGQAAYESMPLSERHGEYVQMRILDDPLPRIFLFSAVESFGLTVAGILAFQKRNLSKGGKRMVYGLVGILVVIIAMLSIKIYLMERSAEEIMEAFGDRLESDTNILIDISSRNRKMRKLAARINAELRLLRKERRCYQQGNQELKDSVTNISHDLRTPLTAICGYLNLLKHEEKSAAVETYLVQIQSGVDVLRGLTEELFRYSIVTSSYELKREKINVVSVLEESLLSFYASMQEKGIQPVISMPEEPVWRMLDISALNRIFSNVIGNALKYSDGDLTVELKENGTIIFSNTAKTLNAVIVGRLFDRFCTVGTSYYATGLGLSIAKILTERMGGHIRAEYRDEMLFITVQFCISLL